VAVLAIAVRTNPLEGVVEIAPAALAGALPVGEANDDAGEVLVRIAH
jgi:hypothetical protein